MQCVQQASSRWHPRHSVPNPAVTAPSRRSHGANRRATAAVHVRAQQSGNNNKAPLPSQEETPNEVTILQALTAIGLSGTIAVSGAALCGIDLSGQFHWERAADLQLALQFQLPLLLLEAALFLPAYSIPGSMLEAQQPQQQQQQLQQQPQQQQQRFLDVAALGKLSVWGADSWRLMLAMLGEVMRRRQRQQQRVQQARPQQQRLKQQQAPLQPQLPLPASLGLLAGREYTKELLQRGFFLTGLAGWLTDRLYEADVGAAATNGLLLLPGGVPVTVHELGLLAASVATTTLFAPAAYIAAEEAAAGVSGALLLNTRAGAAVAGIAAAAVAGGRGGVGHSSHSSSSSSSSSSAAGTRELLASRRPGGSSAGACGGGAAEQASDDDDEEEDENEDPLVLEYRVVRVTEQCWGSPPAQLAYRLTLAKELGRIMLANLVFVVTQQNLAATLTGGLVANALLLTYGRLADGGATGRATAGAAEQP